MTSSTSVLTAAVWSWILVDSARSRRPNSFGHDDQHREQHQNEQAELPVHGEQEARATDERDDLFRRIDRCIGHDVLNDGDIVHEAGHQFAGSALREEVDRQRLEMCEEMDPEIGHHPLGDPGGEVTVSHRT
jgi:hypothetical protein